MNWNKFVECFVLFIAMIEMFFFSGLMLGFNSIIPSLMKENFFSKYCPIRNSTCSARNQIYSYVIISAIISLNLSAFICGVFFDKFGQIYTKYLSSLLFFFGCLFIALSSITVNELLYPGVIILGFCSQFIILYNYSLTISFHKCQNILISIFSSLLDISAVVIGLIGLTHRSGVSIFNSFLTLGIFGSVILLINSTKCLNVKRLSNPQENGESDKLEKPQDRLDGPANLQVYINSKYHNLTSIVFNRYYLLHIVFTCIIFFRNIFFLSQLNIQLEIHFRGQPKVIEYLLFISSFVFVFGIIAGPFSGAIVDYLKNNLEYQDKNDSELVYKANLKCFVIPFMICSFMNVIMSIFIMIPQIWAVYMSFIAFTITRSFVYSLYSGYILTAFPKEYFGQASGACTTIWGIISFLQYPLSFKDSMSVNILNYILIGMSCLAFIHPVVLLLKK
uniref:Slc43a-6 n=1 Tax=Schmidtea mediterranea TaxID=79327 RepID=A0A0H3YKJ2_SCHMD|nr:slc43a-6 [Schmidtea mediterranea]